MPIPDFQELMRPALEQHAEGDDVARAPLRDTPAAQTFSTWGPPATTWRSLRSPGAGCC